MWARFLISFHTVCQDSGIVSPLQLHWVKGICVFMWFMCNLPPALLAEWPGSFTCHCGNTGVEQTPNRSQHTQLTLEKKILPPLLPRFELTSFRSPVPTLYQQAIPRLDTVWNWQTRNQLPHLVLRCAFSAFEWTVGSLFRTPSAKVNIPSQLPYREQTRKHSWTRLPLVDEIYQSTFPNNKDK